MKQGIANAWLLGLIVIFIALMVAFISTTINYTAAFKMKNEMLSIIEKHKGFTNSIGTSVESIINGESVTGEVGSLQTINLYLRGYAYATKGSCPDGDEWVGITDLSEDTTNGLIDENPSGKNYYYCIAKYKADERTDDYAGYYYRVRIFYSFDVPILSTFLSVRVDGISNTIYGVSTVDILTASSTDEFLYVD